MRVRPRVTVGPKPLACPTFWTWSGGQAAFLTPVKAAFRGFSLGELSPVSTAQAEGLLGSRVQEALGFGKKLEEKQVQTHFQPIPQRVLQ